MTRFRAWLPVQSGNELTPARLRARLAELRTQIAKDLNIDADQITIGTPEWADRRWFMSDPTVDNGYTVRCTVELRAGTSTGAPQ